MTLDLTTLEASLKRDEELAAKNLLDSVKDRRELEEQLRAKQIALDEAFAVIERQRASLAEAVRALDNLEKAKRKYCTMCEGKVEACNEWSPGACANHEARAALSSLQPRKDTP